jgi:hypothetical protein
MIYSFDELSFQILTVGHFFHRNGVYDVKPRPFAAFSFRISETRSHKTIDSQLRSYYIISKKIFQLPLIQEYVVPVKNGILFPIF